MAAQHPELQRYEKAKARNDKWRGLLRDAYKLTLPDIDVEGNDVTGQQTDVELYDDTGVEAVEDRSADLHGKLFPPYQEWMDFGFDDFGGEVDEQQEEELSESLNEVKQAFHRAIDASTFHIEIPMPLSECQVSLGCIILHEGTRESPFRFEALCGAQLVVEEGVSGLLDNVWVPRKVKLREITVRWKDAKLPKELASRLKESPDAEVELVEAMLHDPQEESWQFKLWWLEKEAVLAERPYSTNPYIAFRARKTPGQHRGRGPVLKTLGNLKTLNKAVEIYLANGSIGSIGMWQYEDDGVINPETIELKPGVLVPKEPGSQGLTPIQPPGDFRINEIMVEDLRKRIRQAIIGPEPPPAELPGNMTAYEYGSRVARQQAVEVPVSLRLIVELVQRIAERGLDILQRDKFAGTDFHVGPIILGEKRLKPKPESPLVKLQDRAEAAQYHQALSGAMMVSPEETAKVVPVALYLRQFLKDNGFPEKLLTPVEALKAQEQQEAQLAEVGQAAQMFEALSDGK